EIADKVLEEKLLKNTEAANVAVGLLLNGMRPERRFSASNYGQPKSAALLTDAHYRDLLQKAMTEALSYHRISSQTYNPERDAAASLLRGLQRLGSELDTVTPGGAALV